MNDLYEPPKSELRVADDERPGWIAAVALLLICMATEWVSWSVLPILNDAVAGSFYEFDTESYWTSRYAVDTVLTVALFASAGTGSIHATGLRPYVATLPIGGVGFLAWCYEKATFGCLGGCGLPLWYDVLGLFRHIVPCVVIAALAVSRRTR